MRSLAILLGLSVFVTISSPPASCELLAIGVLVGPVSSGQSGDPLASRIESIDGVWGFIAGGYAEWNLPWRGWSVLSEVDLVAKGFAYRYRSEWPRVATDSGPNATFLSLPVLVSYRFGTGSVRPYMSGGLGPEVLLDATGAIGSSGPRVAAALHIGAGVIIRDRLDMRVRYFRDVSDAPTADHVTIQDPRNHGLAYTVGLRVAR